MIIEILSVNIEILSVNPEILEVIIEASSVALLLSRALCQHGEQVLPIFVANLIIAFFMRMLPEEVTISQTKP